MADTETLATDRTEELRRMAQRAIEVMGVSTNSFAIKAGLPPGAFAAFMRGHRGLPDDSAKILLRRLAKLAMKTPGILPERTATVEAPTPEQAELFRDEDGEGSTGGASEKVQNAAVAARETPDMPASDPSPPSRADDVSLRITEARDRMSDEDHRWLVSVIRKHQGKGSVAALNRRLGLGPTALHGIIRGVNRMSGAAANGLLAKLGEPTRFVRSASPPAPRASRAKSANKSKPSKKPDGNFRVSANKARQLRTLMKRTIAAKYGNSQAAFGRAVGLTGAQINAVLHGRGVLQSTYLKILAGIEGGTTAMTVRPSAAPVVRAHAHGHAHAHAHAHAPVRAPLATLPAAVVELAESRAQTPVAKAAREMILRWQQEAFAFVLRVANEGG